VSFIYSVTENANSTTILGNEIKKTKIGFCSSSEQSDVCYQKSSSHMLLIFKSIAQETPTAQEEGKFELAMNDCRQFIAQRVTKSYSASNFERAFNSPFAAVSE